MLYKISLFLSSARLKINSVIIHYNQICFICQILWGFVNNFVGGPRKLHLSEILLQNLPVVNPRFCYIHVVSKQVLLYDMIFESFLRKKKIGGKKLVAKKDRMYVDKIIDTQG